jgi:hypothetical protein
MFREDFDIQQSDVALLALLACCTQEISTLNDYLSKYKNIELIGKFFRVFFFD